MFIFQVTEIRTYRDFSSLVLAVANQIEVNVGVDSSRRKDPCDRDEYCRAQD